MSVRFALLSLIAFPAALEAATSPRSSALPVVTPAPRSESADLASLRAKAERGNAIAQYNLGLEYAQRSQTADDLIDAFVWLTLAGENGSTGRALQNVHDHLTPAQRDEGLRRLAALRASNPALRAPITPAVKSAPVISPAPIIAAPSSPGPAPSPARVPGAGDLDEQLAAAAEDKRQLAVELASAWKEINRLQGELDSRTEKSATTQKERTTAAAGEIARLQKQLKIAEAALANQSATASRLEIDVTQQSSELAEVNSQLEKARAESALRAKAEQQLRRELESARGAAAELVAANARADQLARRLADAETKTRALSDRAENASRNEAQADQLQSRLAQAESELRAATDRLKAAEAERTQLAAELAATAERERNLSTENHELTARLEKSQAQLASLQSSTATGTRAIDEAQARATALASELSAVRKELEDARTAVVELTTEREKAETSRAELVETQRQLASATAARADAEAQLRRATESAEASSSIAAALATAEALADRLKSENESLTRRLNQAESAVRAATTTQFAELENTRRALADAQQELEKMKNEAAPSGERESRLRQLESENASLAARLAEAEAAAGEIGSRTAAADEASTAQREAEQKLAVALRSFELATKERDDFKARVAELSAKISASSSEIARLEAEARAAAAARPTAEELDALRARVSAAEHAAELARIETGRMNHLLETARATTAAEPAPTPAGYARPTRPTAPSRNAFAAAPRTHSAPTPAPTGTGRVHTITVGDTLSSISRQYYGTPDRWTEILAANRDALPDERSFVVGKTLRIP